MQIIYGQIQYCANSLASIFYILLGMWEMCAVFFFLTYIGMQYIRQKLF